MSPEREWTFRIRHILQAIERIRRYITGMTFDQFVADERTRSARVFLHVPWNLMEGMRHVLVHDYESIRLDTVWKTAIEDLPPLVDRLRRLADDEA